MELKYLEMNTLKYDAKKCTGCGMCTVVCPHRVFEMKGKKAWPSGKKKCIECGACMMNCAYGAIKVEAGPGCAGAVLQSALSGKNTQSCCCE